MVSLLLFLGLASFLLVLVLTPVCRDAFLRLNVVDMPDGGRKSHACPIPRIGGIAILASYLGSFGLLLLISSQRASVLASQSGLLWQLLPPAVIVFATGLMDDIFQLKPWQKLIGQFIAAFWVWFMGVRILGLGSWAATGAPWWSLPLTVFWLIGCTNAFNLIDGVDGLATGIGLFATLTTLLAALMQGHLGLAIATVPLAGCLLGFLRYNFNPASIFLGDSGSLLIGFLLGCYAIIWSQKSATLLGMVAPMMALALPLMDVGLSIVRRFMNDKPIFGADRGHIHHRLLARGWAPRNVALALYAVCGVAALFSLLQSLLFLKIGGVIVVLFCILSCYGIRQLDYVEFGVAGKMLVRGALRRALQDEIYLRNIELDLQSASTIEQCWRVVCGLRRELALKSVSLQVAGYCLEECDSNGVSGGWHLKVPLLHSGHLVLEGGTGSSPTLSLLPLVTVLQSKLNQKVQQSIPSNKESVGAEMMPLALLVREPDSKCQATHAEADIFS